MGIDDVSLAANGTTDPFITGQEQDALKIFGDPTSADGKTPKLSLGSSFPQGYTWSYPDFWRQPRNNKYKENRNRPNLWVLHQKEITVLRGDVRPGVESTSGHDQ